MSTEKFPRVLIIGAGLAGTDAANYLTSRGVPVVLIESKRLKLGPAQKMKTFGELVCTNSLKSMDPVSGHGLLKYEMDKLGSLVLECGRQHAVPAGSALAVDREKFSQALTDELEKNSLVTIIDEDVVDPIEMAKKHGCEYTIVASGPLTTPGLTKWIEENISGDDLHFYDAIAPVVEADSLDFEKLYFKDRYQDVEEGKIPDYLNAPMNKEQYESFVQELIDADKVPAASFEKAKYFESCLPVDLMAQRGVETLRFSCMKPVGLAEEDGNRPYAVIQLRRENLLGEAYNLVGFQNRLTYSEQVRVFRKIPGFENATFPHLGSVHRNTFLDSKKLLHKDMSSREFPRLYFAGQITGVEGYTESASMGLYVATQIFQKISGKEALDYPVETGIGALVHYIHSAEKPRPTNINFGLLPSITVPRPEGKKLRSSERKKMKKELVAKKAREVFDAFFSERLK